jgi:polysaccharide deacetylase 2 family uncharacterized protein YibQ
LARRRKKRGLSQVHGGWLVAVAVLCFAAGAYWAQRRQPADAPAEPPPSVAERTEVTQPRQRQAPVEPPAPEVVEPEQPAELAPVARGSARIALVIDDLGRNVADVDRLQRLAIPWTGAVLPYESRTIDVVTALREEGVEYLCHLPMQPANANPGPGALRLDMTPTELASGTRAALAAVPGASGVNNHMGSVLSSEREAMRPILDELAARDLFYVDSRTSPTSVGYQLALELGLAATERQVFLDADAAEPAVELQFERLLEVARRRGAALAIGHPHPDTFTVLEREVPRAVAAGYEFVPASYLLDRPAAGLEQARPR